MKIQLVLLFLTSYQCISYLLPVLSRFSSVRKVQLQTNADLGFSDEEILNYLQGNKNAKWKGNRNILIRKKQVPNSALSPIQVVETVTRALQINDDPQLDHGCQVLLEFSNPDGIIRQSGLDAAEYGRYLRSSDYAILIENSDVRLVGEVSYNDDQTKATQRVEIVGGGMEMEDDEEGKHALLDFFLSKVNDLWLIDIVLKAS